MNLNSDTAKGRGVRTAVQALIGFFVGLIAAVIAVPGVAEAALDYVTANLVNTLVLVGLPSAATGVVSWIWNIVRKDVKN
jgi:hypothetical protein